MGRTPNIIRDAFGEHLLMLRIRAKLTMREVSKESGIPVSTLSKWENSGNVQNRVAILRLAKTFGVSASVLLADIPQEVHTYAETLRRVGRRSMKKTQPVVPLAKTAAPQADGDAQIKTASGGEV